MHYDGDPCFIAEKKSLQEEVYFKDERVNG